MPFGFQPLPSLSLSPQCPQAGVSPGFNSTRCTQHPPRPRHPRRQAPSSQRERSAPPHDSGGFCDTKPPTTPEDGPERGRCSGLPALDFTLLFIAAAELQRCSLLSSPVSPGGRAPRKDPNSLQRTTKLPLPPSQHFTSGWTHQHLPGRPQRTKWLRTRKHSPTPLSENSVTAKGWRGGKKKKPHKRPQKNLLAGAAKGPNQAEKYTKKPQHIGTKGTSNPA